jgi:hypothetical protein
MATEAIDLMYFDGVGLIFECPTGVRFTSQVGGLGCLHPSMEGVFCPLPLGPESRLVHDLRRVFGGSWHSASGEQAEDIDRILRREFADVRVDRSRLEESFEAWVRVVVGSTSGRLHEVVPHPPSSMATLIWQNSD